MVQSQALVDRNALHRDVVVTMNPPETSAFWTIEESRVVARRLHGICKSTATCLSVSLDIGHPMLEFMQVISRKGSNGWEGSVEVEEMWGDRVVHAVELI